MSVTRAWRFPNAPPKYDKDDEDKFRSSIAQALQVVAGDFKVTGGSGALEVDSSGAIVAAGVNTLNLSNEFVATVTQTTPTVVVGVSLATVQPNAHTWSAAQTFSGAVTINATATVNAILNLNNGQTWDLNAAAGGLNFERVGVASMMVLTTAALTPASTGGLTLGTATLPWGASWANSLVLIPNGGADPGGGARLKVGGTDGSARFRAVGGTNQPAFDISPEESTGNIVLNATGGAGGFGFRFQVANIDKMKLDGSELFPTTAGGLTLGTSTSQWSVGYFGSAAEGAVGSGVIRNAGALPRSFNLQFGTDNTGWAFAIQANHGGTIADVAFFYDTASQGGGDFELRNGLGRFDGVGTRFGASGTGPVNNDVLSFDGSVSKWRPRFLQTQVNTGVLIASANGDGTFSVFANNGHTISGTTVTGPTPTVTAIYGGFIIDMGRVPNGSLYWDIEWTNDANANTGGPFRMSSQTAVFQFFSNNSAVPFGTTATKFQFKASETGSVGAASYGTASAALAASTRTEVNAFGLIVASQIACVNLAAISADLGVVSAGVIADAIPTASQTKGIFIKSTAFETTVPAGWTSGIFLAGANPMPAGITYGIDLTATGSSFFIKTPNFTVDGSGNVVVNGTLSTQAGTSGTYAKVGGVIFTGSPNALGWSANFGPSNVWTVTIKGSTLVTVGAELHTICRGRLRRLAGTASSTVTFSATYGGSTITGLASPAAFSSDVIVVLDIVMTRTASNAQRTTAMLITSTQGIVSVSSTATTVTDTSDQTLALVLTGTTSVQGSSNFEYDPDSNKVIWDQS